MRESVFVKSTTISVLCCFCFALISPSALLSQADYAAAILSGISNEGQTQQEPYVTAGDRAYLIGTQDGNFPDMGDHVPGEMGGLWLHPIKLIDGFRAEIRDTMTGQMAALSKSTEFRNYPYGSRISYGPVLDSLEIERFQFSPDGQPGLIVQYTFTNAAHRKRSLDRCQPGLVFRSTRHHRRQGHRFLAGEEESLSGLGRPAPVVRRLGSSQLRCEACG